jgi:hypothetical protein
MLLYLLLDTYDAGIHFANSFNAFVYENKVSDAVRLFHMN